MLELKGKWALVTRHAFDGMNAEQPCISVEHLCETIENPDRINGEQHLKWIGNRTVIAYVTEFPDYLDIHGVSATRRKNRVGCKKMENINIKCHMCDIDMTPDILQTHFPKGVIPTRGYRCLKCNYELIPLDEAGRVQKQAESLGLYGNSNYITRKITKSGNNLAIYIPKEFERSLHLEKGKKIQMWLKNDEICIRPI